jgi:hypothetical protein
MFISPLIEFLMIGRFCVGWGSGLSMVVGPIYLGKRRDMNLPLTLHIPRRDRRTHSSWMSWHLCSIRSGHRNLMRHSFDLPFGLTEDLEIPLTCHPFYCIAWIITVTEFVGVSKMAPPQK